ncbi:MAG: 4-amino-4-deoxy-L-arabinose transferase or related glycosyltransferase of PMT family [Chloroflexi bacterium AL-N10]|nr:4-amino-4-deoxy-L-arabinose transferase or related glycosyltransferase of PMT family [Chloroflexi bacterium AL-N1]NOK71114.1 4-amino-4-deoxy-L-arabinose transferase or related glycosyltransferase of PMT family [Chloroflexi bacterium AL-N10]NOK77362.1 4-amino-4-deoxy-L-arabinose transferase or related glycosyltransferase of PMT family [Chloroflexi bacterium AL-N5]
MSRNLTTNRQAAPLASDPPLSTLIAYGMRLFITVVAGTILLALVYQIPVTHAVDLGGYDSAYVQGFHEAEQTNERIKQPYLAGSDGSARWTRAVSYLLFPQVGLPAQVTLRLRGWQSDTTMPEVVVLLNGTQELDRFRIGEAWEERNFTIDSGLRKANDVVIEIRAETSRLSDNDVRQVGVLIDQANYQVGQPPITPYPAQLVYGALAFGMLYLLCIQPPMLTSHLPSWFARRQWMFLVSGVLGIVVFFLVFYRLQPLYPYPLRGLLPTIDATLAALVTLRYGPLLTRRVPVLLDVAAIGGIAVWTGTILFVAQNHLTLSLPGVESDFRVFAQRSAQLWGTFQPDGIYTSNVDGVLRADGFYNIGYPFLLWLTRPLFSDNPFLAARLIAALSGAMLLIAGWWLARQWLGRGWALLVLALLVFNPMVASYALYLGTDMPFAALSMLALALLLGPTFAQQSPETTQTTSPDHTPFAPKLRWLALAGFVAGLAFLMRHPGILLLPFGWLAILFMEKNLTAKGRLNWLKPIGIFTLAFLLAMTPQVIINIAQTGQLLFSWQAKNIWLAVFAGGDWNRWDEVGNDITLSQIIAQEPGRFLLNWWINVRAYFGTGGEDTSEFGRAIQIRLLAFPANWIALAGGILWFGRGLYAIRQDARATADRRSILLLSWTVLYVASVCVGLTLPRFFLLLAPIYALAAVWVIAYLKEHLTPANVPLALISGLVLLVFLQESFIIGTRYVLDNQSRDQVAIIRVVQATLAPEERLIVRTAPDDPLGEYSAIAHLALSTPATDDAEALRNTGADYLLWSDAVGTAPPFETIVEQIGPYKLYTLQP